MDKKLEDSQKKVVDKIHELEELVTSLRQKVDVVTNFSKENNIDMSELEDEFQQVYVDAFEKIRSYDKDIDSLRRTESRVNGMRHIYKTDINNLQETINGYDRVIKNLSGYGA